MTDNTYIYRVDCSRLPREQYIAMLDAFDSWCAVLESLRRKYRSIDRGSLLGL